MRVKESASLYAFVPIFYIVWADAVLTPGEILKIRERTTDYQAQFDFLIEVRDKLPETHQAITNLRPARSKINDLTKQLDN